MKKKLVILLIISLFSGLMPAFSVLAQDQNNLLRLLALRVSPTDNTATIIWSTNLPSTGLIRFGLTNGFDNWVEDKTLNTYHETTLSGLAPDKKYYFSVEATAARNIKIVSDIYNFVTKDAHDAKAPAVTNVHTSFVTDSTAVFVWETDEPATSCVHYGTSAGELKNKSCKNNRVKIHDLTVNKLKLNTLYYYQVSSKDKANNQQFSVTYNFRTNSEKEEKIPELIIYELSPFNRKSGTSTEETIITVKTNRPVEGYINYGESAGKYKTKKFFPAPRDTQLRLTLSNLKSDQTYYFRVYLKDVLGKELTTQELRFNTLPKNLIGDLKQFNASDPSQDFDHDGLTNSEEIQYGTDPLKADTDGDGYIDGTEVAHGYNPLGIGRLGETKPVTGEIVKAFAYGKERLKNLSEERRLAEELKNKLNQYFNSQIPKSTQAWYVLVNAYIYGGYPLEAVAQAIKWSGKTVHPSIPWNSWQNSDDYRDYIDR
ncbi:MAG: fibronectin type III domain-containing protein [bacterium]|nr:fibronectin type III domain-containing protein [bacterium]